MSMTLELECGSFAPWIPNLRLGPYNSPNPAFYSLKLTYLPKIKFCLIWDFSRATFSNSGFELHKMTPATSGTKSTRSVLVLGAWAAFSLETTHSLETPPSLKPCHLYRCSSFQCQSVHSNAVVYTFNPDFEVSPLDWPRKYTTLVSAKLTLKNY